MGSYELLGLIGLIAVFPIAVVAWWLEGRRRERKFSDSRITPHTRSTK